MDPLKMYFLLKMGIFHGYVSLPEGTGTNLQPSQPSEMPNLPKFSHLTEAFTSDQLMIDDKCGIKNHLEDNWLVVEPAHLKNMSQIGNLPQIEVKFLKKMKPPTR